MRIFNIEDYGAAGDGKTDCTKAFNDIIGELKTLEGKKSIVFGTGIFLISDVLEVTGIDDLTIQGNGISTIILQEGIKKGCIWLDHCNDIKLSGFSFDMSSLPYCQGIVRKVGDCFVEIETSGEFSDKFIQPWFFEKILNIASIIKYSGEDEYYLQDFAWYKECERISENRWRVGIADDGWLDHCGISEGDGMYFLSRGGSKDIVFKASGCRNIHLENLTAYAGSSLTMKLYGNENIRIKNLSVRKKHGRMISTNADGIHASDNRGKFEISGCFFEGMADDGINVHNSGCDILEVISDTEIRLPSGFSGREGDHIQIIDVYSSHRVKGESKIISRVKSDDGIKITMNSPIRKMASGKSILKINDSIIMAAKGDHAYVHESCGRLHVHDCYFGHYRGRGVLAHSNALIENNIFDNDSASAIQVTMDSVWPEGPVPKNIMIRNNKFISGSNIPGQPVVFATWIAQDGFLRNISIVNNSFSGKYFTPPIFSANCNNIEMNGNIFPDGLIADDKIETRPECITENFIPYAIRAADFDDCLILGMIKSESWKAAYTDVIPLQILNGLSAGKCGEKFHDFFVKKAGDIFLLYQNNCAAGYISQVDCNDKFMNVPSVEIQDINVLPSCVRNGLGKRLLDHSIDEYAKKGYKRISLWIFEDNFNGRRFFEKSGFSHDGSIKEINLGKPVNLYHYSKIISR
ncbi:MAG: GNAT family N-acetyltransferase [Saccharofermentanales bacterium]